MPRARAVVDRRALVERAELVDERVAERSTRRERGAVGRIGQAVRGGRPALAVAADPRRGGELAQPRDRRLGPRAEERDVAADEIGVGALPGGIGEHGLQRRQVAVHVVQKGEHAS